MNINEIPTGSIITRTQPSKRGDCSYNLDKMEYVGMKCGVIFLISLVDNWTKGEIRTVNEENFSEGWEVWPTELEEEAKKRREELFPGIDLRKLPVNNFGALRNCDPASCASSK